jgi:hypothetical protein
MASRPKIAPNPWFTAPGNRECQRIKPSRKTCRWQCIDFRKEFELAGPQTRQQEQFEEFDLANSSRAFGLADRRERFW